MQVVVGENIFFYVFHSENWWFFNVIVQSLVSVENSNIMSEADKVVV